MSPDWHGTTGRDDLVGGGDATQFTTTIEGIQLCSIEPFTEDEKQALAAYFRLLRKARDHKRGIQDLDSPPTPEGKP